jgi:hypothetical protein
MDNGYDPLTQWTRGGDITWSLCKGRWVGLPADTPQQLTWKYAVEDGVLCNVPPENDPYTIILASTPTNHRETPRPELYEAILEQYVNQNE